MTPASIVPSWAAEFYADQLRWHDEEALPWRRIGFFRLYGAEDLAMRDMWHLLGQHAPDLRRRVLGNLVIALDVAPELVMPEPDVLVPTARDTRPDGATHRVRDRRNVLARRLIRNLRAIRHVAPSECRAASGTVARLFFADIERIAAAFEIEPDKLRRVDDLNRTLDITHHRWTHLGWRQHRRAVDVLRNRIVRDARDLAAHAPQQMAWLEHLAVLVESLPAMAQEHAGWIETEREATYLLWARNVDHLTYGTHERPKCVPRYLRWADLATIALTLFGDIQIGHNAPDLISEAVCRQRARPENLNTFADTRQ